MNFNWTAMTMYLIWCLMTLAIIIVKGKLIHTYNIFCNYFIKNFDLSKFNIIRRFFQVYRRSKLDICFHWKWKIEYNWFEKCFFENRKIDIRRWRDIQTIHEVIKSYVCKNWSWFTIRYFVLEKIQTQIICCNI